MKNSLTNAAALAMLLAANPAIAAEENAADLETYSVGDRRPNAVIEKPKITIERPKLDMGFSLDQSRPSFDSSRIAKPQLEILGEPAADATTGPLASAAAGNIAGTGTGETRAVQPLNMEAPGYPRDALRTREEGFVVVEFTVNAFGKTESINVVESEPRGSFDREAIRAVSRWEFQPALRDGRPVTQRIRHTIEFKLD